MITDLLAEQPPPTEAPLKRTNFKASEAGDCRRAIAYSMRGTTPDPMSWSKALIFADGRMHHAAVRRLLHDLPGITLSAVEKEFTKTYKANGLTLTVSGHPDGILNHDCGLEIKSINRFAFKDLQRTHEPKESHANQSQLYMWLTGLKHWLILLKNKDTSELLELPLARDDARIRWLLQRFVDVAKALGKKTLPNRDYALGSRECYQCQFFGACWGAETRRELREGRGYGKMPKVADLSLKEAEGRQLHRLAAQYETLRKDIAEAEEQKEKLHAAITHSLHELRVDQARVKDFHLTLKSVTRQQPDRTRLAQLIKQGLVPVVEQRHYQLTVEKLEEPE
jgi:hypothetical protein